MKLKVKMMNKSLQGKSSEKKNSGLETHRGIKIRKVNILGIKIRSQSDLPG